MTLDTDNDAVNVSVKNAVATVTLNRPEVHNAWDGTLGEGLERAMADLSADPEVRAVVLTGAGGTFCSGADLATGFPALPSGHDDLQSTLRRRFNPGILALADSRKPVVAAVHGPAIGAGACLAMASDIAVMGPRSYLQFRFSLIGLMPDVGATSLVADAVGPARAMEIFMLAEKLGPDESVRLGLVSRQSEDPLSTAQDLAARLAQGPTQAYTATKKAIRRWARPGLADQLEVEGELQQSLIATRDWAEGRSAFLEHRAPRFRGL